MPNAFQGEIILSIKEDTVLVSWHLKDDRYQVIDKGGEIYELGLRPYEYGDMTPVSSIESGKRYGAVVNGKGDIHRITLENLLQEDMFNVSLSRSDGNTDLLSGDVPEFMNVTWKTSSGTEQRASVPVVSLVPLGFVGDITIHISKHKHYLTWRQLDKESGKALATGGQIVPLRLRKYDVRSLSYLSTGSSFSVSVGNGNTDERAEDIYDLLVYRRGHEEYDYARLGWANPGFQKS